MQLRKASFQIALNNPFVFRDVVGYEGLYKISYNGFVYSSISNRLLRPGLSNGYLSVVLCRNSSDKRTHTIHTILATAFLPNPENKKCVNHKLGIKTINHKELLEWATYSENTKHAFAFGLHQSKCNHELANKIRAIHIKADKNFGAKALSEMFGISTVTIRKIVSGEIYTD